VKLQEIREMPTTCDKGGKIHESTMRAYHILNKVMELVQLDTPKEVIVEIWEDLVNATESKP